MPHERELDYQTWLEDAEKAASAGDLERAEALLRGAARAQEDHLGPAHADLASTFNNLGIVCEQNGHVDDAEAFYRRAYAIATAVAGPADPLVETAARNLRDFCQANGRPVNDRPGTDATAGDQGPGPETPAQAAPPQPTAGLAPPAAIASVEPAGTAAPPAAEAAPTPPPRAPAPPRPAPPSSTSPSPRPAGGAARSAQATAPPGRAAAHAPRAPSRPPVGFMVGVAAAALLATAVVAGLWQPWADDEPAATDTTTARRPQAPSPAAESPRAEAPATESPRAAAPSAGLASPAPPTAAPPAASTPAVAPAPPAVAESAPAPPAAPRAGPVGATDVRVVTASVCASLSPSSGWRCTPLEDATAGDSASYFTRVASPRPLQVQHLWFEDGRLVKTTRLAIGASPTEGFRTYSRQGLRAGRWRVELRSADGTLLHEAEFDVRP